MALLLNPVSLALSAKAPKAPLNDPSNVRVAYVKDHRARSDSCVSGAIIVEYQGSSANGRVHIRAVEEQRSSTSASIEVAAHVEKERTPTECRVCSAGDDVKRALEPSPC